MRSFRIVRSVFAAEEEREEWEEEREEWEEEGERGERGRRERRRERRVRPPAVGGVLASLLSVEWGGGEKEGRLGGGKKGERTSRMNGETPREWGC